MTPEPHRTDIAAWKSEWLTLGQARSTIDQYQRFLRTYLELHPGKLDLGEARAYVASATSKSATQGRYIARAMKAYSKFLAREYDEPDVLAKMRMPQDPTPNPNHTQPATADHLAMMLATCDDSLGGLRDSAIIRVLASTGMRCAELARLTTEDVDVQTGVVVVRVAKNNESRKTRMDPEACRAVRRYRRKVDAHRKPLFLNWQQGAMSGPTVSKMMADRAEQAGCPEITAHSFRRGFAVQWLKDGGSQVHLETLAGWKSPQMVARYVRQVAADEALSAHERLRG